MKKTVTSLFLIFLAAFFYYQNKKDVSFRIETRNNINMHSRKVDSVYKHSLTNSQPNSKLRLTKKENSSAVKSMNNEQVLSSFPRTSFSIPESHLSLVNNIQAFHKKIPSQNVVTTFGGYFVYRSQKSIYENIIFNSELNQYGVLTNEIIVHGTKEEIEIIANKYQLETVRTLPLGRSAILKTQDSTFFISNDFINFTNELGLSKITVHVNYGKQILK